MFMRVNSQCARPSLSMRAKAVHRPVRRSHEVAKVEARSAKADLQELRPASHQARPPHDRFGWAQPSVECLPDQNLSRDACFTREDQAGLVGVHLRNPLLDTSV